MASSEDSDPSWYMMGGVIIILTILLFYVVNKIAIHHGVCLFEQGLLYPFTFVSDSAQKYFNSLDRLTSADYAKLTLTQLWEVHTRVFYEFWMWICMPISGFLLYRTWVLIKIAENRHSCSTRRLSPLMLMRENLKIAPCIAPAVQSAPGKWRQGEYCNILDKPYDSGAWMTSRSPIQFCIMHEVLIDRASKKPVDPGSIMLKSGTINKKSTLFDHPENQTVDIDKLQEVLVAQIGPEFGNPNKWSREEKGLAGALFLFAKAEKKKSQALLDSMSMSYTENEDDDRECSIAVPDEAIDAFGEYLPEFLQAPEMARHDSFRHVWFVALLQLARSKGVLPAFYFLWLRPLNRGLWYAMTQMGGREPYAEGLAVWSHFRSEEVAKKSLDVAFVHPAVDGVVNYLKDNLKLIIK